METKRGRPQHPGPVTPAESRVLELVQAGIPNAEIAVRLGVSINTVRYHVSNLLAKAGVEDRRQLARWTPKDGGPGRGAWAFVASWKVVAAAAGTGLALFAGSALLLRGGEGDKPAITVADNAPLPTATPRSTVIAGRTMLDAGPLFLGPGGAGAVRSSEARESLIVVQLALPAVPLASNSAIHWQGGGFVRVRGGVELGGVKASLEMRPANDDTAIVLNGSINLEVRGLSGVPPSVIIWADDHHADIGSDGHLYIEANTIAGEAAVAYDTGERLDVSRATKLGPLDSAWTLCVFEGLTPCFVIAYAGKGPVLAPLAGVFRCRADGIDELTGTDFRLEFRHLSAGHPDLPCEPTGGPPRNVQASDALFPSFHTLVTAFGADGKPVSLAVAGNGTLYAGDIPRRFGCPCRAGN
ncbi:MAG: helix-turn-helix transcriptional regulator [Tepidiformaceae bacterium]